MDPSPPSSVGPPSYDGTLSSDDLPSAAAVLTPTVAAYPPPSTAAADFADDARLITAAAVTPSLDYITICKT